MKRSLRHCILALLLLSGALSFPLPSFAEAPKTYLSETTLELCRMKVLGEDEEKESTYFERGKDLGFKAGLEPAKRHMNKQTKDAYSIRIASSHFVIALAFFLGGALLAALIITLLWRRPRVRWSERLLEKLAKEWDGIRSLECHTDPVSQRLLEQLSTLGKEAGAYAESMSKQATAIAKKKGKDKEALRKVYSALEELLSLAERVRLYVHLWQEEQNHEEEERIESEVASALKDVEALIARGVA